MVSWGYTGQMGPRGWGGRPHSFHSVPMSANLELHGAAQHTPRRGCVDWAGHAVTVQGHGCILSAPRRHRDHTLAWLHGGPMDPLISVPRDLKGWWCYSFSWGVEGV